MDRERPNMFESPESPKREAPFREPEAGDFEEIAPIESSPEDDFRNRERINRIKEKLQILPEYQEGHGAERREDNMSRAGYIPDYLRERRMGAVIPAKVLEFLFRGRVERRNTEKLPETGPFLVISNHFASDAFSATLFSSLARYDAHFAVSSEVHWQNPLKRRLFRYLRAIEVPGTLSYLSDQEREKLLNRIVEGNTQQAYQQIIEKEPGKGAREMVRFVRSAAALLARGDVVVVYPEGHWLYDGESGSHRKEELYRGYRGIEVIGKQFEKYTGEGLRVVPIAVYREADKRILDIGDPFQFRDVPTGRSGTDWAMRQLARLLPEEQRGYYRGEGA